MEPNEPARRAAGHLLCPTTRGRRGAGGGRGAGEGGRRASRPTRRPGPRWPNGRSAQGDPVTAYAYARTGYHRGLDQLRRSGWKGHGPVPWEHEPNRGFLRSLHVLGRAAAADRRGRRGGALRGLPSRDQRDRRRRARLARTRPG